MKVKAISNNIKNLQESLTQFAFNQDQYGRVDLTVDKEYVIYGIKENKYGTFYLVLTDEINKDLPWWMPAQFFTKTEGSKPATWRTDEYENSFGFGHEKVTASAVYFGSEEDIEDGTQKGY